MSRKKLAILYLTISFLFACTSFSSHFEVQSSIIPTDFTTISTDTFISTNTKTAEEIELEYGYHGPHNEYTPEVMYYSEIHDTLIVSYKDLTAVTSPSTNLLFDDLVDFENYILTNISLSKHLEYDYALKIIRLYPNTKYTYCEYAEGCSDINEGYIDVYSVNKNNLYNHIGSQEAKINTFAHEYGHIAAFYILHIDGNIDATEYLKLRLGNKYKKIFPKGPHSSYFDPTKNTYDDYYLLTAEIEADDYLQLFCSTITNFNRQSLSNNNDVKNILELEQEANNIRSLYQSILANPEVHFKTPLVITRCSTAKIKYYTDYTLSKTKTISTKYQIYLIVYGGIVVDNIIYLRIALTNAILPLTASSYESETASRIAYIKADNYAVIDKQIYVISDTKFAEYILTLSHKQIKYAIYGRMIFQYFINDNIEGSDYYFYDYIHSLNYHHYTLETTNKLVAI